MSQMNPTRMNPEIPISVRSVCMSLENEDYEAWVVGGCVRDTVTGRAPHDWDVATSASPERVIEIFNAVNIRVEPTGIKHGTVTVMQHSVYGSMPIEVTTFRGDGEYTDGRRPDSVTFVKTIQEDLARRDFTINAMAFRPATSQFVDPFNGLSDIRVNRIKCVGDARERFMEDGLRVMRACRFSAQLGFFIAADTKEAMRQTPVREKCLGVAKERLFTEFRKLILSPGANHGLQAMNETGLLDGLVPGVDVARGPDFGKTFIGLCGRDEEQTFQIRMAALLLPFGGARAASVMSRLRSPAADSVAVDNLVSAFWGVPVGPNGWNEAACRWWLAQVGKESARAAIALVRAFGEIPEFVEMVFGVLEKNPPVSISELCLNGMEVAEVLDIQPGRRVGDALRFLLAEVIKDPEANKPHRLTKLLMMHAAEFRR